MVSQPSYMLGRGRIYQKANALVKYRGYAHMVTQNFLYATMPLVCKHRPPPSGGGS